MSYFDESYYLNSKLKQLAAANETDANGNAYTMNTLKAAIADAGLTPESHYKAYGAAENLNPSAYFNESEYLQAKLNQLKSVDERDSNGQPYTIETLKVAIANSGLSAAEHYEQFGSKETTADGHLLNPSNAFDANAYVAAKLAQLQSTDNPNAEERAQWEGKSVAELVEVLKEVGISPVTHYTSYGAEEATATKIPLVQTVPSEQRVPNDPVREVLKEIVPTNYNAASPAPAEAKPAPVTKPADVGQKVDVAVSPPPIVPATSAPVPGDTGYVMPPENIKDTVANPVIPPSSTDSSTASGNWVVLNPDKGTGIVVGQDGSLKGEVKVEISTGTGTAGGGSTVVIPPAEDKPVDTLPPVTAIPPSVELNPDNPDNVSPELKPDPKPDPGETPDPGTKPDPEPDTKPDPTPDPTPTPVPFTATYNDTNKTLTFTGDSGGEVTYAIADAVTPATGKIVTFSQGTAKAGTTITETQLNALTVVDMGTATRTFVGNLADMKDGLEFKNGGVKLDATSGADIITLNNASLVEWDATTTQSGGADAFTIKGISTIAAAIAAGDAPVISFDASGGTLNVVNGATDAANDTINLKSVSGGAGNDALVLGKGAKVTGDVNLGAGNDSLNIINGGSVSGTITMGAGKNAIVVGKDSTLDATKVTFTAGEELGINLSGNGGVSGKLDMGTNAGAVNLTGGTFASTFSVSGDTNAQIVTVGSGATMAGNIDLGSGNDSLNILDGGNVTGNITMGDGKNAIVVGTGSTLDAAKIKFTANEELGINLSGNGGVSGALAMSGAVTVNLTGGKFASGFSVSGDTNAQIVTVGSGATMEGTISLGSGNDSLNIVSGGNVTGNITMGAGDNAIVLSGSGSTLNTSALNYSGAGTLTIEKKDADSTVSGDLKFTDATNGLASLNLKGAFSNNIVGRNNVADNLVLLGTTLTGTVNLGAGDFKSAWVTNSGGTVGTVSGSNAADIVVVDADSSGSITMGSGSSLILGNSAAGDSGNHTLTGNINLASDGVSVLQVYADLVGNISGGNAHTNNVTIQSGGSVTGSIRMGSGDGKDPNSANADLLTIESGGSISGDVIIGHDETLLYHNKDTTGSNHSGNITFDGDFGYLGLTGKFSGNITGEETTNAVGIVGEVTGKIDLAAGNDIIAVETTGKVSGDIVMGGGNDRVTIASGGTVTGKISGGAGKDTITLDATSGKNFQLSFASGDNGSATGTISGSDVITGLNSGDTLYFEGYSGSASTAANGVWGVSGSLTAVTTNISTADITTIGDNMVKIVRGAYSGDIFTASGDGNDALLIYDSNSASGGITQEVIVLMGVSGSTYTINADGHISVGGS